MNRRGPVLILTNPQDPHADAVIHFLYKQGIEVVRYHAGETHIDSNLTISSADASLEILSASRTCNLKEARSVWYRRPNPTREHVSHLDQPNAHIVAQETNAALWGQYGRMDAIWYSHPYAIRHAAWKLYQLHVAEGVGLTPPAYMVSTDPDALKGFLAQHRTVVIKPIDEKTTCFERDGKPYSLYIKKFESKDLETILASRPSGPVMLQAYVKKDYDVRVTIMGKQAFAVEIHPPKDEEITDFRPLTLDLEHAECKLPTAIEKQLLQYMRRMHLNFGAFDFAVKDGVWYFLECNPNGQWLWIEIKTGIPLAETFSRHLALLDPPLCDTHW